MELKKADITMTNDLIRGKNDMNECEYKLFCAVVSQIDPFKSNGNKVLINKKEFFDLLGLTSENRYNRWIKIAMGMIDKCRIVFERNGRLQGGYAISWVEDKGDEGFEFTISRNVLAELEKLEEKQYATWLLRNTTALESAYAMKLYAYLCSWKDRGMVEVDYQWLRNFYMVGEKYKKKCNFEQKCIAKPVKEINEKTNMYVEWFPKKERRGKSTVTIGYLFKFELSSTRSERKELEWEEIRDTNLDAIDVARLPF